MNAVNFTEAGTSYSTAYPANPTNETVFIVFNNPAYLSGLSYNVLGGGNGARIVAVGSSLGGGQGSVGYLSIGVAWQAYTPGNSYTFGRTAFITGQVSGGTTTNISINGGSFGTPGSATYSSGAVTCLGQDLTNSGYYYIGYAMEYIFYNSVLSTSQRQQVEGYLAWKWGLQSNLPSTHAYAKFSP